VPELEPRGSLASVSQAPPGLCKSVVSPSGASGPS
jgi:hypothetical protein